MGYILSALLIVIGIGLVIGSFVCIILMVQCLWGMYASLVIFGLCISIPLIVIIAKILKEIDKGE